MAIRLTTISGSIKTRVVAIVVVIVVIAAVVLGRTGSADIASRGRREFAANFLDRQVTVLAGAGHQLSRGHGPSIIAGVEKASISVVSWLLPHVPAGVVPLIRFVAGHVCLTSGVEE
jgi:hypothetical protein